MAEDKEVLKEVWEGRLPICFKLSLEECSSSNEPDGLFLSVPRQSYFYLIKEKIHKYFSDFVNSSIKSNEIWLDFNGLPLKWHYPIGLLYDLHVNMEPLNHNLPWIISVHFEKMPEKLPEIVEFGNKDSFQSFFISTIKEADALKHKGKIINEMRGSDHKQLWFGFQNDKFDQFWTVNKKLMETDDTQKCFKSIPFRIYQINKHFVQKPFQPTSDSGKKQTLNDLLNSVCGTDDYEKRVILIQGISPPLDTPIQWLSEHLSYPDNFLHICLK